MANRIDELREMSDAELDFTVCEVVLGWKWFYRHRGQGEFECCWLMHPETPKYPASGVVGPLGVGPRPEKFSAEFSVHEPPKSSSSIAAAFEMQAEIESKGMEKKFVHEMRAVLIGHNYAVGNNEIWKLINATPRQRTIAAILATEAA